MEELVPGLKNLLIVSRLGNDASGFPQNKSSALRNRPNPMLGAVSRLGAMLEPLYGIAVAAVEIPSTNSTPQPTDL